MEHNSKTFAFKQWQWNWTEFCPTGLKPWEESSNDLYPCFQEICLQLPLYSLYAVLSSYQFGIQRRPILRDKIQKRLLSIRILSTLILALIPIINIIYYTTSEIDIYPADVLVDCLKFLTWVVHSAYLFAIWKYGDINHRGSLFLNVVWISIFAIEIAWFRSSLLRMYWVWSLLTILLNCIYLITLVPSGKARFIKPNEREEEQQSILGNRYVQFNRNINEIALGRAQEGTNIFSKILFYWVEPLISKGISGNLKGIEDLFDIPECLNITKICEQFQVSIATTGKLFWALHKNFGKEFYLVGILRLMENISGFAGPILLGGLLKENNSNNTGTDQRAYIYAAGLFIATLISAFCGAHFNWQISLVGMKMKIAVVTSIYRKSLEASTLGNVKTEILNLMSTDTDRIVNSCISFHSFWSIPFQLITTLYLLYTQMGAAFIAGVAFAVFLIPVNRWLAVKIGNISQLLMAAKDARITSTSEIISSAKQIKLNAWEDIFIKKILGLRRTEIKYLSKRKYLDALCVYFWATTPVIMSLLTFGVSVLLGNPLNASTTYTSVALLNMLIGPLNTFPWVLNGLVEAWISVKRVQQLLELPNLDISSYYSPIVTNSKNDESKSSVLQIIDGSFVYDTNNLNNETNSQFKLENVNINIKKGELVCIDGPVGGGKSTLISAIIAAIECTTGTVCIQDVNSGFGYVAQTHWLQRGTIRENIVWGSVFNETRYKNVIFACCLEKDIEDLGRDSVGVGENGRTLSGGQRARISLARAIYQDKNIYLLDNILSSLDAHVAKHIVKYCILGLIKNKTRIIVTDNRSLFYYAHQILHVKNGSVTKSNITSENSDISEIEDDDYSEPVSNLLLTTEKEDSSDSHSIDSLLEDETREYGTLSSNVISTYCKSVGGFLIIGVLLFIFLMQATRNLSDAWLAHWVNVENQNNNSVLITNTSNNSLIFYLGVYTSLAIINSLITLVRAFLFAYAGIRAAVFIHNKLLEKVIYTKFYFFDITSVGRILNRFSSDTYSIDDTLPFIINILLAQVFGLAGAIIISIYAMPWLALIIIPMCPVYFHIQHRYRYASRDIKRLSSNSLSPLYSHFTETLQGISVIRAMRASPRFQRDFHVKLEESIKAQLSTTAAQQWLGLRLQLLGTLLVGGSGIIAALTSAHSISPGLVGLSISYALSITSLLNGVLNAFAETEQEMIAVERIGQYLKLEEEDGLNMWSIYPPFAWPSQGVVSFKNVKMKYREHLVPSLDDINFTTNAFERIGIIGRTGAGKSSLFSALLRVSPLSEGNIFVDSVNLKTLPLKVLRDRIVIIQQEPFLFEGSLRENLDPRRQYLDSELWNAINSCLAMPIVQNLGGLNGFLERGGANLSTGQKQLLCLARALLKNSKVVCIDEGTSSLDKDSEAAVQYVIRNSFKSSTVFFIAHHLKGLHYMDRIFAVHNGKIIEEGSPRDLGADNNSTFAQMLHEQ